MSELLLVSYPGDSSKNIGGLSKGTSVFIYDLKSEPPINMNNLIPHIDDTVKLQTRGLSAALNIQNVISNINYVKRELGMFETENNLENTINFKFSTKKKITNDEKKEDYIYKKF